MDQQQLLTKDISELIGLPDLSEDEQAMILNKVGATIIDSVILRMSAELTDEQQEALEQYLETNPEPEVLLEHLSKHYQIFNQILEEEIKAFKEEAIAVLGNLDK